MSDVVGSTRLWETVPAAMRVALARHDELIKIAVESHGGVLVRERGEGDSTFSVFRRATDAAAAVAAQLSLNHEPWPAGCVIQVRMAMHTGEASERDGDYYGRPVNRVARLRGMAEGGQILVGQSAAEILLDHLPAEASLIALGVRELPDFDRPEKVYLLGLGGPIVSSRSPADAPEPAATPGTEAGDAPEPVPPAPEAPGSAIVASWQAVVDVDLAYYERSGVTELSFPHDVDRRVIPLTEHLVVIGRPSTSHDIEPQIDLSPPFEDPGVSRRHALLERQEDGRYVLMDPGSTNGTFLNDLEHPIPQRVPVALEPGDRIYLGAWTMIEIQLR